MNSALQFFSRREWQFEAARVRRLRGRLAADDAAVFNLDVDSIDWNTHVEAFVAGARRYVLRQRDEDLDTARGRMYRLQLLHYATQLLLAYAACRLAVSTAPAILRAVADNAFLELKFRLLYWQQPHLLW
ncbi:unnamed protein product [Chrysodeixis includens]|uniref:Fatty acyl-CoA reductase C-terminal domain-containing protein n=1 Tax=Chrysodeixis includens TaxID=689277 RepID=A0A9P0BZY3_CHRIL|nr:unnamed protein product [Chrysodeixis includens]